MPNKQTVFIAKNLSDVFYHLNSVSGLQVVGGCTSVQTLEEKSLTVRKIPELQLLEKREHYFNFGSSITLSEILKLGKTNISPVLYEAIETVATPSVRNLATIGGNICAQGHKHTLFAPLLALDARLEFQNANNIIYIPFSKFTEVPNGYILTRIRVPVNEWEVEIFRRVGPEHSISPLSAGFVFLVDTQRNFLANVRIAFAGPFAFRSTELENTLIGIRLPISARFIDHVISEADNFFTEQTKEYNPKPVLKDQFLNLLRYSLNQLT